MFIKNREEKEETDETPSDGYYSSHSKRKKYIFREEYFDYTGIALKHLSIELFPNIGDGTLFTRFTNNFWYEAEQLKEMVAKVIWKLDNVQPYSYDIYNKIYNRLASEEEMDWGRKKDLCKFFELAYITYN